MRFQRQAIECAGSDHAFFERDVPHMPTQPARVLICEDQVDAAQTLAALVRMRGYEVRVCHDGRSAIDQALDWRPNAAIIDIGLPGISGYGVAQFIRELSFGGAMVLIAVTGYGSPADVEAARYAGFNWHFSKPAAPSSIIDVLESPNRTPRTGEDGTRLNAARDGVVAQALGI